MEAMAAGRPVISTAVGGVPELVEHGRSGFLVPAGDATALANAMRALLNETQLGPTMGECAAARARERFDTALMSEAYLRLYEERLANR
jgi:glycosyltransferase involved in cell wall biosynthesis